MACLQRLISRRSLVCVTFRPATWKLSHHPRSADPLCQLRVELCNNASALPEEVSHKLSTHVSADGSTPRMVDVGNKAVTRRTATARTRVLLPPAVTTKIEVVGGDVVGVKGPIFTTAITAGVQAAKKTSELIPFCHPLSMDNCSLDITLQENGTVVEIDCTVHVTSKTGVEMEAMTGATVAALTVYDMLKGLSHDIVIQDTRLMSKTGGKRTFNRTDSGGK